MTGTRYASLIDTQAIIEATGGIIAGAHGYATDLLCRGYYDGSQWVWPGIRGSMYIPGVDIVVGTGAATPFEVKNAAANGWTPGSLVGVTFPTGGDEHYLAVTTPGMYRVIWSLSGHTGGGGATGVHGGIMIDGVATRNDGEGHRDVSNFNDDGNMASACMVDCPNGTEQISLWVAVDNSNDFHAEHGNVEVAMAGGT